MSIFIVVYMIFKVWLSILITSSENSIVSININNDAKTRFNILNDANMRSNIIRCLTCFFCSFTSNIFHANAQCYICCCEVHPLPAVLGVKSIGYKSPPTWHERGASTVKNIIQRYTQNSYKNLLKSRSLAMESILEEYWLHCNAICRLCMQRQIG